MWYVLLVILLVICLFKMKEPFQNQSSPKADPEPKSDPEQKADPEPKSDPEQKQKPDKPDKPDKQKQKPSDPDPIPYVQRNHVGVKEPLDSRLKCPSYYEDINKDILVEYQKISDAAYGYTPSRYLDVTRFVDTTKFKVPLSVEPDFFMHLR